MAKEKILAVACITGAVLFAAVCGAATTVLLAQLAETGKMATILWWLFAAAASLMTIDTLLTGLFAWAHVRAADQARANRRQRPTR